MTRIRTVRRLRPVPALAAALILVASCAPPEGRRESTLPPAATRRTHPVLLAALDGLEWTEVLARIRDGEMPVLARLMETGRYGYLGTFKPTLSPVIWTSVATGKLPSAHGITSFARAAGPDEKDLAVLTSHDRRVKAFWNILTEYDRRVGVLGWWMTYPVEAVNGVMVAQVNTLDHFVRDNVPLKGGVMPGVPGQVHPPELEEQLLAIHDAVAADLDGRTARIFGEGRRSFVPRDELLWQDSQWAFRADATYLDMAHALDPSSFDVFAVYVGGTDVVGHRYWRHAHPEEFVEPPSREETEALGGMIRDYYRHVDRELGRLLDGYRVPVNVIVVADHGMHADNVSFPFSTDLETPTRSGGHDDGPQGVAVISGPGVRPLSSRPRLDQLTSETLGRLGSVVDITPTLLALAGVPVGADMVGKPWWSHITVSPQALPPVPTHDDPEWIQERMRLRSRETRLPEENERLEQLRSLGYIE